MKNKKEILKIFFKITGYILVAISLYFIYRTFRNIDLNTIKEHIKPIWILYIAIFSILYSFIFIIQGINWNKIAQIISMKKLNTLEILSIYLTTNIGKYLPGNIFHFVGRHFIVRKYGISDLRLLFINLTEIIYFLLSSIIMIGFGLLFGAIKISDKIINIINSKILIIAFVIGICFIIALLIWYKKKAIIEVLKLLNRSNITKLIITMFLYFIYFLLSGLLILLILKFLLNIDFSFNNAVLSVSVFSLSWFLGYIVPGASGGIGIRELIMVMMFSPVFGQTDSLLVAILSRIITLFGEVLVFVYGRLIWIFFGFSKKAEIENNYLYEGKEKN